MPAQTTGQEEFFDRFGNFYNTAELMIPTELIQNGRPVTGFDGCECENLGINTGYFNVWFEDCFYETMTGFNDPDDPDSDDVTLGEERRTVVCRVFEEIAGMIALQSGGCGGEQIVNVRIRPSQPLLEINQPNPLPNYLGGVASAYYWNYKYGIVDGFPWIIINTGEIPGESDDLFHGEIRINFEPTANFDWWYGLQNGPLAGSGQTDLYSVVWHEALHMLGFASLLTRLPGRFTRYDLFLRLLYQNGPDLGIIVNAPFPGFNWEIDPSVTNADLYSSCQDAEGTFGPDMIFRTATGDIPVLANDNTINIDGDDISLGEASHSHLNINCDNNPTGDYLMHWFLPPETRRAITEEELKILCSIGYTIEDTQINNYSCGCTVAGAEDFGPACVPYYQVSLCETLVLNEADLIANDNANVSAIQYLGVRDPQFGQVELNLDGTYTFTPARLGLVVLTYIPKGCNGQIGNPTNVYVIVTADPACPTTYECTQVVSCDDLPGYNCREYVNCQPLSSCNLICNPQICGTIYRTGGAPPVWGIMDFPYPPLGLRGNGLVPNWTRTHGTPDFRTNQVTDDNGFIILATELQTLYDPGNTEGVMTTVELNPSNYLFSLRHDVIDLDGPLDLTIDLIEGAQMIPQTDYSSFPGYSGSLQNIIAESIVTDEGLTREGVCFQVADNSLNAIWIYLPPNGTNGSIRIDDIELVEDNFTAGPGQSSPQCGEPVILGDRFCMLSDVEITYEWHEFDETTQTAGALVAAYSVIDDQATPISGQVNAIDHTVTVFPEETTTYRLRRTVTGGSLSAGLFNGCTTEDFVTVTVENCPPPSLACCPPGAVLLDDISIQQAVSQNLLNPDGTGQDICISGTLTIDVPSYGFFSNTIIIGQSARIEINPGSKLYISNSHIQGCDYLWDRILVNSGAVVTLRGCTVEDGLVAVEARNKSTVLMLGATFDNNYLGLWIPPIDAEQNLEGVSTVRDCVFSCTEQALKPMDEQTPAPAEISFAGIEIHNLVVPLVIPGPFPDNSQGLSPGNRFDGMLNGIIAENSHLAVAGARFSNILRDANEEHGFGIRATGNAEGRLLKQTGLGLTSGVSTPSFENCAVAISVKGASADISGNYMKNVDTGVLLENCPAEILSVKNNFIDCNRMGIGSVMNSAAAEVAIEFNKIILGAADVNAQAGISIEDNPAVQAQNASVGRNEITVANGRYGILLQSARRWIIRDNIIDLQNAGSAAIAAAGSQTCRISCNVATATLQSGNAGIHAENTTGTAFQCNQVEEMATGIEFFGTCTGTDLAGNHFAYNDIGLHLNYAVFNQQHHRGNTWLENSFGTNGARFDFIDFNEVVNAQFFVDQNDETGLPNGFVLMPPNPFPGIGDWFIHQEGNTFACGILPDCEIDTNESEGGVTETDIYVAGGEVGHVVKRWIAEKDLYRKLANDPSLAGSHQGLSDFYDANENGVIGSFYDVSVSTNNLYRADSASLVQIQAGLDQMTELILDAVQIEQQLENASGQDSLDLIGQKEYIFEQIDTLALDRREIMALIKANRVTAAPYVQSLNQGISTTSLHESLEWTVNDIYLGTVAAGIDTFSQAQVSDLLSIAYKCPMIGGDAVYTARSLYALIDPWQVFDDDILCGGSALAYDPAHAVPAEMNPASGHADGLDVAAVFPNPGWGSIIVVFNRTVVEQDLLAEWVNLFGRVTHTERIPAGDRHYILDASTLQAGLYILRVRTPGVAVQTFKIIISN
jgi:nitrous oxidase accessory protein NosD